MREKVATIVPKAHLNLTKDDTLFMALVHVAVQDADYVKFFEDRAAEGKYVILDDSAIELGEPISFWRMLEVAQQMDASEIVLPDYFRDNERTFEATKAALEVAQQQGYTGATMACPHGKTKADWLDCARKLLGLAIDTLGISYRYTSLWDSRRAPIQALMPELLDTNTRVHLLGSDVYPAVEVYPLLKLQVVRGVDSARASVFAKHQIFMEPYMERPPRTVDFLLDKYEPKLITTNVNRWRRWCVDGPD